MPMCKNHITSTRPRFWRKILTFCDLGEGYLADVVEKPLWCGGRGESEINHRGKIAFLDTSIIQFFASYVKL
jgi:hypothetical protein